MHFSEFVEITHNFWDRHLDEYCARVENGAYFLGRRVVLYPNILLCTRTKGFFIGELLGAEKTWTGLQVKHHSADSVEHYFHQFDALGVGQPVFQIEGRGLVVSRHAIAHPVDDGAFKARFPYVDLSQFGRLGTADPNGPLIRFTASATCTVFHDCILVNRHETSFRIKHVNLAIVVSDKLNSSDYARELSTLTTTWRDFQPGLLVRTAGQAARDAVAAQLANLFLSGVQETTIGEFVNQHPDVIKVAFNTDHFVYEPILDWVDGERDPDETAINPDLLVRRSDGFYDIVDLKTALLGRSSIVCGERRRRRLIHPVYDGVAQLAHYAQYFETSGNATHARERYGVAVRDPALILIVGSHENVRRDEVNQALRAHKGIEIIDYDTLAILYTRAAVAA